MQCALHESIDKGTLFYLIIKNLYYRNHANAELDIRYLLSLPGHRHLFESVSQNASETDADFIAKVLAYEQYEEPPSSTPKPPEATNSEPQNNDSAPPPEVTKPVPTGLFIYVGRTHCKREQKSFAKKSSIGPVKTPFLLG